MVSMTPQVQTEQRLLLVDDEEPVRRSLVRVLAGQGWQIQSAGDGESALQLAQSFQPHVVVSDFRMPGMNGVDLLTRIKAALPKAQRIMLTGQADHRALAEAINRSEVFRFLAKPWDNGELILTIRSAFEQVRLLAENDRLHELTQRQNEELKTVTASLEARVLDRTFALSTAKREWETAFDAIDAPLAVVDEQFQVRRANRAYASAAGKQVVSLGSKPRCHEYLFGSDQPCPGCPLQSVLSSGKPQTAAVEQGGRQWTVSVYPVPEEHRAVCTYRDMTEEFARQRQHIDTEKMAAVGQLAGGVAHEINNPLGGILAFSQLMKRDGERSANDKEALDLIEESALRCKRIVDSLLKFSRRTPPEERKPLNLSQCMEDTAVLFKAQLKSTPNASLELDLAAGLPSVMGNAVQLGQIALNLLQNALQALPDRKGKLRLETGVADGGCFLAVADSGSGIPAEDLPHIFEPWFTTKRPGEGTGLGLAICQRIAAEHGGTLRVESAPGKGSRFTLSLPAVGLSERTNP
jgi:two-component system NtrC family sensor kinase